MRRVLLPDAVGAAWLARPELCGLSGGEGLCGGCSGGLGACGTRGL